MRRFAALFLSLVMLLGFAGCSTKGDTRINPITFYYKNTDLRYNSEAKVLYGRDVDLENDQIPISEVVSLYLEGPDETFLESPFPPNARLEQAVWTGDLLKLTLSDEFNSLTGLDRTLAMACLTLTLTQVKGIDRIQVFTSNGGFSYRNNQPMSASDFVLEDLGGSGGETVINLYFSDETGTFLLLDSRSVNSLEYENEASYVVQMLLEGPKKENLKPVLPDGTILHSAQISNGVCTVDFSGAFLENRPDSAVAEHLAIYAVVNSLTELPHINAVRFTVEGQRLGQYLYLNLSEPIARDETAIGPVRVGLNEFQATLYASSNAVGRLVGVPARLRRAASQTMADAVLSALLQWMPPPGLENPIPAGTTARSVSERDGVCYVDLSSEFLDIAGKEGQESSAVQSLVSTLCRLPTIRRVRLTVEGRDDVLESIDLSEPIASQYRWSVN